MALLDEAQIILKPQPQSVPLVLTADKQFEDAGKELLVRFRSVSLFELANHLVGRAGDLVIEGPAALKQTMEKRLAAAHEMLRPKMS